IAGAVLWGIGMGAQDSILKAAIATAVPKAARARAYGVFFSVFGAAWWVGSTTMGWLYEVSLVGLVVLSVVAQLAAAVAFLVLSRRAVKWDGRDDGEEESVRFAGGAEVGPARR